MIAVRNLTKVYDTSAGQRTVLDNVDFSIKKGERVGILGRNGAGKSTFIRMMSGAERPTSGVIDRDMSLSWPLAFSGGFQGSLTGLDNLKFICRIYGADYQDKIAYVESFSELGDYLREPVKKYSSGMRARLAFALSMAIDFDCFLIDEIIAVGDSRFHKKCEYELFQKRADKAMIIVSHSDEYVARHCTRASVLVNGMMKHFLDNDSAIAYYHANAN